MRVRRRLASSQYLRDIAWQASGNIGAQVVGIAAMPVLTRLYDPSDFAALNLFSQAVAGLAILLTFRFEYLVMLPAEQRESDSLLRLIFCLGGVQVLWMTPLFIILPSQWAWLRAQGSFADWLWLAPLSAWSGALAVGLQQSVQRKGAFRASAVSDFAGRIAYVACAMLGATSVPNLVGLMLSNIANAGAKLAWLMRFERGVVRSVMQTRGVPIANSLRRLAGSTSVSNLISLFSGIAPIVFIADRYGSNALGQYGLVVSTLYLPSTLLGQAIGQVYYQRASGLRCEDPAFTALFVKTSLYLAKISVPVYALIAIVAPFAYPLVFGADWGSAGEMARWLCIAAATSFLSSPLDRTSLIVGAWWYLSAWHAMRAAMTAGCLFLSEVYALPLESFVLLLSLQNALAYGIDLGASFLFTKKLPPFAK